MSGRRTQGLEVVQRSDILQVQTASTGANWVQLASGELQCQQVVIYNESGTDLRWRYCDLDGNPTTGKDLPLKDGTAVPVRGIQDARQVQVKRADESDTQVTANFLYEGV